MTLQKGHDHSDHKFPVIIKVISIETISDRDEFLRYGFSHFLFKNTSFAILSSMAFSPPSALAWVKLFRCFSILCRDEWNLRLNRGLFPRRGQILKIIFTCQQIFLQCAFQPSSWPKCLPWHLALAFPRLHCIMIE